MQLISFENQLFYTVGIYTLNILTGVSLKLKSYIGNDSNVYSRQLRVQS